MCGVNIAHTSIMPDVSISLTEMSFLILQVNVHTSNDFCDLRLRNAAKMVCTLLIPILPNKSGVEGFLQIVC